MNVVRETSQAANEAMLPSLSVEIGLYYYCTGMQSVSQSFVNMLFRPREHDDMKTDVIEKYFIFMAVT